MASDDTSSRAKHIVSVLFIFSFALIAITFSAAGYSNKGYSFVKYPGFDGEIVVCVEGEVTPTNQTLTVETENDAVSALVNVNNKAVVNHSVTGNGTYQIDALRVGCNTVSYGGHENDSFKIKISYLSHYRPVIEYLEVGNLKVGSNVRYFISTKGSIEHPIKRSWLNITDITRDAERPVLNAEFDGPTINYKMAEPGNYRATIQVYDGFSLSDIYEASFTSHVITTQVQQSTYIVKVLDDDKPIKNQGYMPPQITPEDHDAIKFLKRTINGGYIMEKLATDYLYYKAWQAKKKYINWFHSM